MADHRVTLLLFGVLLMAGAAAAGGPDADTVGSTAEDVTTVDTPDAPSVDTSILDLDAVDRVGSGIESAGAAVGDAASAVGGAILAALTATATFLGDALAATGRGIGASATFIGSILVTTGSALATAGTWTGRGIVQLTAFMGSFLADIGIGLWTAARDAPPAYQAAGGATATTAAAGTAAWRAGWLRKLKALPLLLGPLYARLAKEDLLDHPVRSEIYERVRTEPGTHTSELARDLDLPWGTLLHHLDKLEDANFVTSTTSSGKKCYFLPGAVPSEERDLLPALKNETAHRIAAYFKENPGAIQSDAARDLELSAAIVSWHVKRLTKAGVLERTRQGRSMAVSVEPRAAPLIA